MSIIDIFASEFVPLACLIKMKGLLTAICVFMAVICSGQSQFIKVDFSYFATKNPVFKLGYEKGLDSSFFTLGGHIELGQYAANSKNFNFSSFTDYELFGAGILAESKYFILPEKDSRHYGGFISGFVLVRSLKERYTQDVSVSEEGFQLQDMNNHISKGIATHFGFALGYRSGCYAGPLHLEGLIGYGFGNNNLGEDHSGFRSRVTNLITSNDYFRAELSLIIDL